MRSVPPRSSRGKTSSRGASRGADPTDSPERLCGGDGDETANNDDGTASAGSSCENPSDSEGEEGFQGPLGECDDGGDDDLMMALAKSLGGENGARRSKKGSRKSRFASNTDKLDLAVSGDAWLRYGYHRHFRGDAFYGTVRVASSFSEASDLR